MAQAQLDQHVNASNAVGPRQSPSYIHAGCNNQWDARFNFPTRLHTDGFVANIKLLAQSGWFSYCLVGGVEVGRNPLYNSYGNRHVHCAFIFHTRIAGSTIMSKLGINKNRGYYLVPRDRKLSLAGWRDHHVKDDTKVEGTPRVLFEDGYLPLDGSFKTGYKRVGQSIDGGTQSELKRPKQSQDQKILEIRALIEGGKEREACTLHPAIYYRYADKIKSSLIQNKPRGPALIEPHLWIWGRPGTGKTQICQFLYPKTFKKDLNGKFWELYEPDWHDHVMLEDLDHTNVDKLGIQFLKTICDEDGFTVDQKYKACQPAKTTVLVTSNFDIYQVIPEGKGVEETRSALYRRFTVFKIEDLLCVLNMKLKTKEELNELKLAGNIEKGALFHNWDYLNSCVSSEPIKDPEYYRQLIIDMVYT